MSTDRKAHLTVAIIGNFESGKSTLAGSFYFHSLSRPTIDRREEEEGFSYGWAFDRLRASRERPLTLDCEYCEFETTDRHFTVISVPAYPEHFLVKNATRGIAVADAVILVVAANKGEFEAAMKMDSQMREHLTIAKAHGIQSIIVAVNKIDSVPFPQQQFEEITSKLRELLKKTRFNVKNIPFIPIAANQDENVYNPSNNLQWYAGQTLLEALTSLEIPRRPTDMPVRVAVHKKFVIKGTGIIVAGTVLSGTLIPGAQLQILPDITNAKRNTQVFSIEIHNKRVNEAIPGDMVGIKLLPTRAVLFIKPGCVLADSAVRFPLLKSFTATIVLLRHPNSIRAGYQCMICCHTCHIHCSITEFKRKMNKHTGEVIEECPNRLVSGDAAEVEICPIRPMWVDVAADFPRLARFTMRDGPLIGFGVIQSVSFKQAQREGTLTKAAIK